MTEPARLQHWDLDGPPGRGWRTSAALRPRALPTDTFVRFSLLLATVAAASLYLYQALWFVLRGETFVDILRRCGFEVGDLAAGSVADTAAVMAEQAACRSGIAREQSAFALAGTGLVLIAAYGVYRLLPRWRARRADLVSLDPVDGQALRAAVSELAHEMRLGREPEVLVDAANPSVQAFAFGTAGRPRLGLTGGLVVQQALDPPAFRAVLRHELAHMANRDVPWTYYTVAVWWCFVALALVPVVAVFTVSDPQYVLRLGWRTALLAGLVLLVRNAVLRARETYADARAAEWGSGEDLHRLLAVEAGRGRGGSSGWHRGLLWRHPAPEARRGLLTDPDGLFRADLATAFFAGVATGTAFVSLESIAVLVLPSAVGVWVAAVLVAPLMAAVLCVGAWRAGLRSCVRAASLPVAGPLAVGSGLGLALGPLLSFEAAAGGLVVGPLGAAGYVAWGLGVAALAGLVARYAGDVGRIAVRTVLLRPSPRPLFVLHVLALTAATAALLAYGHLALTVFGTGGPVAVLLAAPIWLFLPAWFGDDGAVLLGVLVLVVVTPVVVWQQRSRLSAAGPAGTWAWREQPPPGVPRPAVPPLGPALGVSALIGVVAAGWHVLARLVGAVVLDEAVWRTDNFKLAVGGGTTVLVGTAVVVAAGAAAVLLPRRWWALGLLGGLVALVTAGTGVLAASVAAGCGLLPRAGPPDCGPPRAGEVQAFVLQPLVFAAVWAVLVVAAVGVLRGLSAGSERRTGKSAREQIHGPDAHPTEARPAQPGRGGPRRPEAGRVMLVGLAALALLAIPGIGTVAVVAGTDVELVEGPGYTVALPVLWTAMPGPDGVPVFATLNQQVRAELRPIPATQPTAGQGTVDVGGVRAWLVAEQTEGPLVLRSYDLSAPPGPYRLRLLGTPAAIDAAADEELAALLSSVRWSD